MSPGPTPDYTTNDIDWVGPFPFAGWPIAEVPAAAAGVYLVWEDDELLYVGMSGRGRTSTQLDDARSAGRRVGLWTRLNSHASGRRSGDQFCVYVADRLVLSTLTPEQIALIARDELRLDHLVKHRIRTRMHFSFAVTPDGCAAGQLDRSLRAGAIGAVPRLNPLPES